MSEHYRRDGTPYPNGTYGMLLWARDWGRFGNRVVDETWTPYGERLSTVWLGLDHGWGQHRPVIFETMLFSRETHRVELLPGRPREVHEDLLQERWHTEEEARTGHQRLFLWACIPPPLRRFVPFWKRYT